MDAGSAILAAIPATLAFLAVVTALRRIGRTDLDVVLGLGRRIAQDPSAAFPTGLVAAVALGALGALVLAMVWDLTGWPIAPLQGTLMSLLLWPLAQRAVRPVRGGPRALFLALVGYGVILGFVYSPGS